jgi:hypothetical protein
MVIMVLVDGNGIIKLGLGGLHGLHIGPVGGTEGDGELKKVIVSNDDIIDRRKYDNHIPHRRVHDMPCGETQKD